jgi:hypothetical protein
MNTITLVILIISALAVVWAIYDAFRQASKRKAKIAAELERQRLQKEKEFRDWYRDQQRLNQMKVIRPSPTQREREIRNAVTAAKTKRVHQPSLTSGKRPVERPSEPQVYYVDRYQDAHVVQVPSLRDDTEDRTFKGLGGTFDGGGASGSWSDTCSSSSSSSSSDSSSSSCDSSSSSGSPD